MDKPKEEKPMRPTMRLAWVPRAKAGAPSATVIVGEFPFQESRRFALCQWWEGENGGEWRQIEVIDRP